MLVVVTIKLVAISDWYPVVVDDMFVLIDGSASYDLWWSRWLVVESDHNGLSG